MEQSATHSFTRIYWAPRCARSSFYQNLLTTICIGQERIPTFACFLLVQGLVEWRLLWAFLQSYSFRQIGGGMAYKAREAMNRWSGKTAASTHVFFGDSKLYFLFISPLSKEYVVNLIFKRSKDGRAFSCLWPPVPLQLHLPLPLPLLLRTLWQVGVLQDHPEKCVFRRTLRSPPELL